MMPLEKQVASLELSKKLKELGMKQHDSAVFEWRPYAKGSSAEGEYYLVLVPRRDGYGIYDSNGSAAFTVAELGEMLPYAGLGAYLIACKGRDDWSCAYGLQKTIFSGTEANARAKMLIYLIENNLIKI